MSSLPTLILCYVSLLALGSGFYYLLCPDALRNYFLLPWLMPAFGSFFIVVISSLAFGYNCTIHNSLAITAALTLLAWAVALTINSRRQWQEDLGNLARIRRNWFYLVFVPSIILLFLLWPTFRSKTSQTPLHIGSDPIGIAIGANYLMANGRLSDLNYKMLAATGKKSIAEADHLGARLVNFTLFAQSDSLLLGRRWGVPFVAVAIAKMLHQRHIFHVLYLLVILFYIGIYYVSLWGLISVWRVPFHLAAVGAIALVLNCNMLNLILEGSYPQVFTAPVYLMLWLLFFCVRPTTRRDFALTAGAIGIAFSFVLISYSECFYILSALLTGTTILVTSTSRRTFSRRNLAFIVCQFIAGFGLSILLTFSYLLYSIRDLPIKAKYASVGGFFQPLWALPSEIFGFFNIYSLEKEPLKSFVVESRPKLLLLLVVLTSIVLIGVFIWRQKKDDAPDYCLWAMPVFFVVAIWFKQWKIDHFNNYQYMKSYTYMLPIFWCTIWESFIYLGKTKLADRVVPSVIATCIIFTGVKYELTMIPNITLTSKSYEGLEAYGRAHNFANDTVFTPPVSSIEDLIKNMLIGAYVDFNWVNSPLNGLTINDRLRDGLLDKHIIVLIRKSRLRCYSCLASADGLQRIVTVGNFIVVWTNKTLQDNLHTADGKINIDQLMSSYKRSFGD